MEILASIENDQDLINYQPLYAAKADVLKRLGREADANACFQRAIELSDNEAEQQYLAEQMGS